MTAVERYLKWDMHPSQAAIRFLGVNTCVGARLDDSPVLRIQLIIYSHIMLPLSRHV